MEATRAPVRVARAVAGGLALATLVAILVLGNDDPTFTAPNFFSSFAVESNVLAVVVLLGLAAVPTAAAPTEGLRAATTVYLVVTAVVDNAALRGVDAGLPASAVGTAGHAVLQVVVPVLVLVDWLLVPPVRGIGRRRAVLFLLYPVLYLGYSLVRGELTGYYPYRFLDTGAVGWFRVFLHSAGIAVLLLAVALLVEQLGRRRGQPAPPAAAL